MKILLKLLSLICLFGLLIACTSKEKDAPAPTNDPATVITNQPGDTTSTVNPTPTNPTPVEKATVIYIVRHGEKSNNSATDPDLSAAGQARALTLKDSLSKTTLAAIYTTNYKRTQQTVAPTAAAKSLTPLIYSLNDQSTMAASLNALATKILKDNLNQNVLIVGHSNTILETVEAFNAQRPVALVNDHEYNYLFKVIIKENKTPVVEVKRYGN